MENPTYYILQGQEVEGSFTVSHLCAKWNSGELAKGTLYSEDGYEKWLHLKILMDEDETARAAMKEQSNAERRSHSHYVPRESWMHRMEGVAEVLEVFEHKVSITPSGVMGVLTKGLKGPKTIPYFSITAIQFKKAGFTSGYIQFTIPGGNESTGGVFDAAGDENTFMFSDSGGNNQLAEIIKNYIETRIHEVRSSKTAAPMSSGGIADEIRKLADLKAQGLLSETEFQSAKTRILGG